MESATYWKRNFVLLALGRFVSILGSSIQAVAIPLFVLDLTHSGAAVAKMTIAYMIPRVFFMPIAGIIGDRWSRKSLMVSMDFLRGFMVCFLSLLAFRNSITFPILYVTQIAMAIMDNLFEIPTGAMFPDIVPKDFLMRANSIMGMVRIFPQIVGPAIGGVLYGFYGIAVVFLANGISFILSAVSEIFIVYKQEIKKRSSRLAQVLEDLKEGFLFVWNHSLIRTILIFALFLNFLVSPLFMVVYPYTVREVVGFSAQAFGILESAFTLGALFANLMIVVYFARKNTWKIAKVSLFLMEIPIILMGILVMPSVIPALGKLIMFGLFFTFFLAMGFLNPLVNVPLETSFQKMTPSQVRARAYSFLIMVSNGMMPLGSVIYGYLVDRFPVHLLYYGVGVSSLLVAVGLLVALRGKELPT
ncbi:MAG: transporter, family, macrolide efflux protein [Thermotogota bacterium]|nr:transporter, family, macrolide efflux protein [Thermotogota bacterium]MDK2864838.1 transporter, family, macrolide efflux protein [Thermotogota bacterium]HCZ06977.1 MFS transporter [Thermotogota bacterium]